MRNCFLLVFSLFALKIQAFEKGYTKQSCDSGVPIVSQNSTEVLRRSSVQSMFVAKPSSLKYRRGRELEMPTLFHVTNPLKMLESKRKAPNDRNFKHSSKQAKSKPVDITGTGVEAFLIQIHQLQNLQSPRVGEFTSWPPTAQPLQCDEEGRNTAITNIDLFPKSNLTFKWKAPIDDKGDLKIFDSYLKKTEYWTNTNEMLLQFVDFPVGLNECGVNKSCVRYSSKDSHCNVDTCEYVLTYQIPDSHSIQFSLDGISDSQSSYVAVGFARQKDLSSMDLTACTRHNNKHSINHYVVQSQGDKPVLQAAVALACVSIQFGINWIEHVSKLLEKPLPLRKQLVKALATPYHSTKNRDIQDQETDEDGDYFGCKFVRPIKEPGDSALNFDVPLYRVYLWGKVNDTNGDPILPSELKYVSQESSIKELVNEYYSNKSSFSVSTDLVLITLSLLLSYIMV